MIFSNEYFMTHSFSYCSVIIPLYLIATVVVAVLVTDTRVNENICIIVCVVLLCFLCFCIEIALSHLCQSYTCVKLL